MAKEPKDQKRQTTPKGYEIPVPKRSNVLRDFSKIVAPLRSQDPPKPKR
jgi:hypothetical protein